MAAVTRVLLSALIVIVAVPSTAATTHLLLRTSTTLATLDIESGAIEPVLMSSPRRNVLTDIVDVSVSDETLYAVARSLEFSDGRLALFAIDLKTGRMQELDARTGLRAVAAGRDRNLIVARCEGPRCFVETMVSQAEAGRPIYTSSESIKRIVLSPDGNLLAVELAAGMTIILDVENGSSIAQVEGKGAAWSPSSTEIAVVRGDGKELGVVSVDSSAYRRVLKRAFWETRIVGALSWSPDDHVAFSVPTGATGYGLECIVLELNAMASRTLSTGQRFCGPWLPGERVQVGEIE